MLGDIISRILWNVLGSYFELFPCHLKQYFLFVCVSVCVYTYILVKLPKNRFLIWSLKLLCWCLSEHCKNITAAFCCYTVPCSRDMYLLFKISPPIAAAAVNCPVTTEATFWAASLLLCKCPQAISKKQETVWKTYLFESGMSTSVRVG